MRHSPSNGAAFLFLLGIALAQPPVGTAGDLPVTGAVHVWEIAKAQPAVPGAPRYSDVIVRNLSPHPNRTNDSRDSLRMFQEFHVTRLEWTYKLDRAFVQQAKALGLSVGGALGSATPDASGSVLTGRVTGKDGLLKAHPWFKGTNRWVGCVNAPEYREAWMHAARENVDAGVDFMQQDDPHMALRCTSLCYCKYCTAAFAVYQQQHGPDASYEQFQKDSVLAFHREMHRQLDAYAGRHVPFSHNNLIGLSTKGLDWTAPAFDFVNAETDGDYVKPAKIYKMAAAGREHNLPLVFAYRDTSVAHNRRAIAAYYANGTQMMLPWDVFMPNDAPRYFGDAEDYADISGFVRANAAYLDGYEEAAATGPGISETRYGVDGPVSVQQGSGQVFAFVRARPGASDAPVVIHLVEWADAPEPFALRLCRDNFFGERPVTVRLLSPAPYDAEAHRKAQASGDFSALTMAMPIQTTISDRFIAMQLPALHPWGILVVKAGKGCVESAASLPAAGQASKHI
jgi:hypothetical protein